ncbi:DUF2380 domain-containing protein [Azospirillum brasilense]|uniref:DUF2380 domain-containing protein n=1 Tax=Azospirillum brasilense TaxID=192 RepID=A0A0P0EGT4_AZOBR|nr:MULTISPECIES: DUF3280 domain-containing protein [Azospirillum]ALJ38270.1 hypothetical protein AMK58_22430 [Azospirillum brasilense]MDW7554387.1 DUF3280 domain-containing protein [Azospirillum brasilense]MDW7594604.1 DUF3280 domain-containing protein [Azospirillum brasilense]MDW7629458.1 DUF3280 domain-containing protein [Azospirillum brasilense]MDX5955695.1 DUF3280 domain-containing protein [Azospirillum brasilense]
MRPTEFAAPALLFLLLSGAAPAAAQTPAKVLVFDLELVDTSREPPDPDHAGRLERVTALLRDGLKDGGYAVTGVHDSAVAAEVPASLYRCNGCERDLGRRAGADIVVTGFIHKISTLILNMQIIMRRTGDGGEDGEIIAVANADIRGDNERSWRRGVDWLLRHRLLAAPPSDR